MRMGSEIFKVRGPFPMKMSDSLFAHYHFKAASVCIHVHCVHPLSTKLPPLHGCSLTGEFWLGLRSIRALLARGNTVLRVQLEDWKQGSHMSEYNVYISGPEEDYAINLRRLSGDIPDPMGNLTGMAFSTKDRDSEQQRDSSCAHGYTGAADRPAVHSFDLLQSSRRNLNITAVTF